MLRIGRLTEATGGPQGFLRILSGNRPMIRWQQSRRPRTGGSHMITAAETTARILVVDDEQSITDLVAMALRYEHFAVQVAHSGREALDAVETFSPDLVVLDIMMPGIDGFEVARRLRNGGASLPVLFLTARDATEDKVRGLTLGGDDYMTKPFSVEELVARIRAILRRVQPADARHQLLDAERLGHVVVATQGKAADLVFGRVARREKEHR